MGMTETLLKRSWRGLGEKLPSLPLNRPDLWPGQNGNYLKQLLEKLAG